MSRQARSVTVYVYERTGKGIGLTSMLPVSGAEQLKTSEPMALRPMTSLRKAYSRLLRPGPMSRWRSASGTFSLR